MSVSKIDKNIIENSRMPLPGNYRVDYFLYKDDKPVGDKITIPDYKLSKNSKDSSCIYTDRKNNKILTLCKHSYGACFRELYYIIGQFKKDYKCNPNRLCYVIKKYPNMKCNISYHITKRWIDICRENGVFPKYVHSGFIRKKCFVFDLTDIIPSQLYFYLCMARYIKENPKFINGIVHLVDKCNMNFSIATVLMSLISVAGQGHHFSSRMMIQYRNTGATIKFDNVKIPLDFILGFAWIIKNFDEIDTLNVLEDTNKCTIGSSYIFNKAFNKFSKYKKVNLYIKDLYDENINLAVSEKCCDKMKEHVKTLVKGK